ncbi:carbonic anhydrase family protein [Thalassotalea fonticola]|uniref:Carbonic anhydrase n=1 Tax=Thalassotalea fonticola TaxID=3065649 RepID=A0ABZ0GSM9_9GAMM|nr:carbonic anhydrase family protein [Colwelliaceae bacterium S1-1]
MKNLLLTSALVFSSTVVAGGDVHWGYSGEVGADNWAKLSPDNYQCSGNNQSPVNLTGFIEAELSPIKFNYNAMAKEILNNGHTVQVNLNSGSNINVDGNSFDLLQFHFHAPSENHINGTSYPLEAHFVHADKSGNLAVVAVMFEQGGENKGLMPAWQQMPKHEGDKHALTAKFNGADILPENKDYYRFNGSLTTPPCSEGVRWLVMKTPVQASKQQLKAFSSVLHEPNNRPIQATNARMILQ